MSTIEQNLLSGLDRELRDQPEPGKLEILKNIHKEIELRIEAIEFPDVDGPESLCSQFAGDDIEEWSGTWPGTWER